MNQYSVNAYDLISVADAIRTKGEMSAQLVFPAGFVTAIQNIQSGVELNFEVVGGMTEPADPAENTIWVKTETEVTGWGFSTTEPVSPDPGMVWFLVGLSSGKEFNALQENAIQICPITAKQYVNSAWEYVVSQIYQAGEWSDLIYYLYDNGDECVNWTGGWSLTHTNGVGTTSLTKNSDALYLQSTGTGNSGANFSVCTANKIYITEEQTVLRARIALTSIANTFFSLGLHTSTDLEPYNAAYCKRVEESYTGVVDLDVSSASGMYHVITGLTGSKVSNSGYCYVYEVWLE